MMPPAPKFCQLDQTKLAYLDFGDGHPLLLVHGFPLNRTMWEAQHSLASRFRLLIPDLPGFGESQFLGSHLALEGMAEQLIQWLDAIEVPKITFCGLSMGGYLGWRFWKEHRQRLAALIACNTRAAGDDETISRARHISAQSVRQHGLDGLANEMLPRLLSENSRDKHPAIVANVQQMIQTANPEMVAQAQLAMAARPDATEWLPEIEIPMLFVAGQFDQITPPAEMQANFRLVRNSKWVELPDAGHLSPMENSNLFNEAVIDFLSTAVIGSTNLNSSIT